MASPLEHPKVRRRLRRIVRWAAIVLAVVLAVSVAAELDWSELRQRLAGARGLPVAAATLFLIARFLIWTWRWHLGVRAAGVDAPFAPLFPMILGAAAVNHLTPAAKLLGGLLRARYLGQRADLSTARAYGTVLFDQLAHQGAVISLTTLAVIGTVYGTGRPKLAFGLALLALLMALGLGLAAPRLGDRLADWTSRRQDRWRRWIDKGRETVTTVRALADQRRLVVAALLLGLLYAATNAAAQWLFFVAVGPAPSYFTAFAAVALGTAAGALLGTPGGVGTTEAAIIGTYVALGVDANDAAAAALLYRGLHYLVVFCLGGASLAWLERRLA
ncbi:MAG: lysylphosphatidylglycerol synthase transmembrane domain-containing protein [Acidobacteriota bacterium]